MGLFRYNKHYRKIQPNGFKAMIVTSSRHAAVLYKNMLDELNAPSSNVVISGIIMILKI